MFSLQNHKQTTQFSVQDATLNFTGFFVHWFFNALFFVMLSGSVWQTFFVKSLSSCILHWIVPLGAQDVQVEVEDSSSGSILILRFMKISPHLEAQYEMNSSRPRNLICYSIFCWPVHFVDEACQLVCNFWWQLGTKFGRQVPESNMYLYWGQDQICSCKSILSRR